ncbi:MAG: geranylgeranyl reductase family protein [Melioribacteraceae bacterium]|nr:geranylgeranyl reductase family protein [Melioribacteraceae bacterium]MCF8263213.1 geranylgeranyl reductase family protein [Melioribacteraceae bacterium]MCF8431202.1 geranylgeranyl reductase family protein [Melioribacteraceae bacterium]
MNALYDVVIIGAGPAGAFASFNCSTLGLKTLLIDKAKFPRYKTCGGGLVKKGYDLIPFDISPAVERECFSISLFDHESTHQFTVRKDYPLVKMVMRDKFDNLLVESAIESGSQFIDDTRVSGIESSGESINIKTNRGSFTAKYLIAADGVNGIVSKFLNNKFNFNRTPALEYEVFVDEKTFSEYNNSARFDFGFIPEGYGWIFPKRDHLSVGIASFNPKVRNIKSYMNDYLKSLSFEKFNLEKHGFIIPFNSKWKTFHSGNILFAGDTAGLPDPITAEGISNALLSGKIAAEILTNHFAEKNVVGEIYSEKIAAEIGNENRYAQYVASLFYRSSTVRKFLLKRNGIKLAELMSDIIAGKRKYSHLVRKPINYVKLIKNRNGKIN